jgi:hypothetical protein
LLALPLQLLFTLSGREGGATVLGVSQAFGSRLEAPGEAEAEPVARF